MRQGAFPRLVLLVVLILASVTAAFYTWRTRDSLEGFEDEEATSVLADGGADYAKRLYVMKLFDALLRRKATATEIERFTSMGNDTDILNAVLALSTADSTNAPADSAVNVPVNEPVKPEPEPAPTQVPTPTLPQVPTPVDPVSKQQLLQHLQDITDRAARSHALIKATM